MRRVPGSWDAVGSGGRHGGESPDAAAVVREARGRTGEISSEEGEEEEHRICGRGGISRAGFKASLFSSLSRTGEAWVGAPSFCGPALLCCFSSCPSGEAG